MPKSILADAAVVPALDIWAFRASHGQMPFNAEDSLEHIQTSQVTEFVSTVCNVLGPVGCHFFLLCHNQRDPFFFQGP